MKLIWLISIKRYGENPYFMGCIDFVNGAGEEVVGWAHKDVAFVTVC
jgi:hypothetical protein